MKRIFYSPVLAAAILSLGLVTSAVIISRRPISSPGASEKILSEQDIKTQFITQMKQQTGSNSYNVMGHKVVLDDVVIDRFLMSPKRNYVDINYHFKWQNSINDLGTSMGLTKDEFGRFDSGDVGVVGLRHYRVIVQ